MTVGERIQQYRKNLNLSQEELGQRLLVSRQTVSQWETDQTMPTLDNMMRLKELFGVSIDAILEGSPDVKEADRPLESYHQVFTKDDLKPRTRFFLWQFGKNVLYAIGLSAALLFLVRNTDSFTFIIFAVLCGFITLFSIISFIRNRASLKHQTDRILSNIYDYRVYESRITATITRNGETALYASLPWSEVVAIREQWDMLILFTDNSMSFLLRKHEIPFTSKIYQQRNAIIARPQVSETPASWKTVSQILFILSILSVPASILISQLRILSDMMRAADTSSFLDHPFHYTWHILLLLAIPITSYIVGRMMRTKGYSYKKNTVIGIIIFVLLCLILIVAVLFGGSILYTLFYVI